jgi:peptidoglycan/LPS O-acetylase OafA/YrhL
LTERLSTKFALQNVATLRFRRGVSALTAETAEVMVNMKADIRSLTGVRGAAAVIIVIYHFGKFRLDPTSSVTVWSVPRGYLAVDMFFMLSGFVIAYVYADAFLAAAPGTCKTFLIKRFARLYPAYIVISALYALKIALGLTGEETFARFNWFDAVVRFDGCSSLLRRFGCDACATFTMVRIPHAVHRTKPHSYSFTSSAKM